jgi:hypothetical protein
MAVEVAEREPPEVDYSRIKRWVIKREGRDYVQYAGLVDLLHQETEGAFEILTRLEQAPAEGNGQTAIVSATVTMAGRTASGLGDASPGNVSRAMAPHLIRMAETRAKGRALRDLLNVPFVTAEELGPGGADDGPPAHQDARSARFPPSAVPRPSETFTVDGRPFTRPQILAVYRQRLAEAQRAGLQLAPTGSPGGPPPEDGPLPAIVAFSTELKARLEARAGAARASGTEHER